MPRTTAVASIQNAATGETIQAQFNPTEIRRTKGVNWAEIRIPGLNFPKLHYVAGNARTIPLRLEFDGEGVEDLSPIVEQFERLVEKDRNTGAPPLTRFVWGPHAYEAVITNVDILMDDFREDGAPTSLVIELSLREYNEAEVIVQSRSRPEEEPQQYIIRQGDTLSSIAYQAYGDASKWRKLAEANGIINPRAIKPGTALVLPPRTEVMA